MKHRHRFSIAGVLLLGSLLAMPTLAWEAPKNRPVLTISGNISAENPGKTASFDMEMIEALPQHSFTTSTPWFKNPVKFTGPLLADVLAAVGANGSTIHAFAINDYTISIPIADTKKYPLIMARLINDKAISVRERGPLFVVYPFDSDAELRTSTFYERSIWQLKALVIK